MQTAAAPPCTISQGDAAASPLHYRLREKWQNTPFGRDLPFSLGLSFRGFLVQTAPAPPCTIAQGDAGATPAHLPPLRRGQTRRWLRNVRQWGRSTRVSVLQGGKLRFGGYRRSVFIS